MSKHQPEGMSTHELLIRLKAGDDRVIFTLYSRYIRRFSTYAKERGVWPVDVEMVIDVVFDRIMWRIKGYDESKGWPSNGEAWLWVICKHVVFDWLSKKRPEINPILDDDIPGDLDVKSILPLREVLIQTYYKLSESERKEIQRGPSKRGRPRNALKEALSRWRSLFDTEYYNLSKDKG